MAGGGGGEKTEKATNKKRQDERKKGNVLVSKDVLNVASLIIVFYTIKMLFPFMKYTIDQFLLKYIDYAQNARDISITFAYDVMVDTIIVFVKVALPSLIISGFIAIIVTFAQTKLAFSMEGMKPKFSRMNPLSGIKNLFSLKSAVEVIKGLIKIAIVIYILYKNLSGIIIDISKTLFIDLNSTATFALNETINLVLNVGLIFVFVGGLDYVYQWWEHERQMKMSKQEIKEEYKQIEGDPQVKGKIKEKQRKMAMSRMMQAVPSADVVVRNPTHFAVALRYDLDRDNAPIVVAKGKNEVALRIVKAAEENNIYVLENVALARAIYAETDINSEIPLEYYSAVAEILALVFKIKNKKVK